MGRAEGFKRGSGVPARRSARRWLIPPAILGEPGETLEGICILEEVGGALGLLLWSAWRDVMLWAAVPDTDRDELFAPGSTERRLRLLSVANLAPSLLEPPLYVLSALLEAPAAAEAERLCAACLRISEWAEQQGAPVTAITFGQAAAMLTPRQAHPIVCVGTVALRAGRYTVAETWLRRAVAVSRRESDWVSYVVGHLQLGRLSELHGRVTEARRFFERAVRAARRHGLREARGQAYHGLFRLALDAGEPTRAETFAEGARRLLGRRHPAVHEIQLELAKLRVRDSECARALPLLHDLLLVVTEPALRMRIYALVARAAAGEDVDTFRDAWLRAWSATEKIGDSDYLLPSLLDLAWSAVRAGETERAYRAAVQALELARRTQDAAAAEQAAKLLEQIGRA